MGSGRTTTTTVSAAGRHPCQDCGACCAKWRVEFYWREAEPRDSDHPVPMALVEDLNDRMRGMKGTTVKHRPRCVALDGRIGESVGCRIYSHRPTPCRAFEASYEDGTRRPRCDEARLAHGLRPLRPEDWGKWLQFRAESALEFGDSPRVD